MVKKGKEKKSKFCDLQCDNNINKPHEDTEKPKEVHEYLGPVKIVLIDPDPATYRRKAWVAACFSVSQLMIGATTMMMFLFVMSLQMSLSVNAHVLLCTTGYQLLMPMTILVADGRETSSLPLTRRDKTIEHLFLSSVGILFGIGGTFLAEFVKFDPKYPNGWILVCNETIGATQRSLNSPDIKDFYFYKNRTPHSLAAWITAAIALGAVVTGPLPMVFSLESKFGKINKAVHSLFGLFCFLSASACFVLGLIEGNFGVWLKCARIPEGLYILVFFCIVYTLAIVITLMFKMCRGYRK